jgi:flagellar hook-associated protein 3 FlgL
MRVSSKMVFDLATLRIGQARSAELTAGEQVASGKRVVHPWDGPAEAGIIATQSAEHERQSSIERTLGVANLELQAADSAMGQVVGSLTRAHELAVQLANSTYSAQDRLAGSVEAQQLFSSVVAQLNARHGDRYLFGGMNDGSPPFDPSGAYLGDANVRQVEVAPTVYQPGSIRADQAFKGAGGGIDVPTELQRFATALATNDLAGIRTAVQALDDALKQVSNFQSRSGGMYDVLATAEATAKLNVYGATLTRSAAEDVDIATAATQLAAAQQGLQAAMSAAAQQFKLSLLDKL